MYNGGKNGSGVYQTIINHIPPHKIYIEPFLGSGAIMRLKKPAIRNIGVEIDKSCIDKFDYGSGKEIINGCGISYLKELTFNTTLATKDIFIYADPPYPKESRRSDKDIYNYEISNQDHIDILNYATRLPCKIAISTYPNELYSTMLQGWNYIDFEAQTRHGKATERLYMNYKAPKKIHDYSFLGKDFTDRQRIQRKIKRHILGLLKLPPLERQAIIEAIAAAID